jgi:hypothetical protein
MILQIPLIEEESSFSDFIIVDILKDKTNKTNKEIPKKSGIYFLYSISKELLYIGETNNLFTRISLHRKKNNPFYVRLFILKDCKKAYRMALENFYIDYYKPIKQEYA